MSIEPRMPVTWSRTNDVEEQRGDIRVDALSVSFGDRRVLNEIRLRFPAGAVTAVIGPSGCGKTTLLRSLNRLTDTTPGARSDGMLTLDGEDIRRMDPVLLRRRVGMVFQKPNPFPMSIRENVLYGVKAQGKRGKHSELVEDCLRQAALWEDVKSRLNHSALALSLGQQQRLCMARALAVSPEVLLMDEPAASLDPISTGALEDSIISMKGTCTVVIVTHDIAEARRVADYVVFMYAGRVVEVGPSDVVLSAPREELTRNFLEGRLLTTDPAAAGAWLPDEPVSHAADSLQV